MIRHEVYHRRNVLKKLRGFLPQVSGSSFLTKWAFIPIYKSSKRTETGCVLWPITKPNSWNQVKCLWLRNLMTKVFVSSVLTLKSTLLLRNRTALVTSKFNSISSEAYLNTLLSAITRKDIHLSQKKSIAKSENRRFMNLTLTRKKTLA